MAIFLNGTEIKESQIDSVNLGTVYLNGVLVARKPTITTQPVGGTITDSQTKTLTVVADGLGSTLSYQWYKNGAAISGATAASYTFDPTSTGTFAFYCRVHGFSGYTDTSSVNVVVNSAAPTITTQPTGGTIYDTQTKTLTVVADGHGAPLKYQWYKDGAAISGATSSSYTFDPSSVGSFKFFCRVTTSGYVDSNTVTVVVNQSATLTVTVAKLGSFNGVDYYGYSSFQEQGGAINGYLTVGGVDYVPTYVGGAIEGSSEYNTSIEFATNPNKDTGVLHFLVPNSYGHESIPMHYEDGDMLSTSKQSAFGPSDVGKTIGVYWKDS